MLYAMYTAPRTYHESQSAKCFHDVACIFGSNQCAPISHPFQIAKYNSYLWLETFCFKIAQYKICNIEAKQEDISLQVILLA